jgi:hypothetical protein
MIIFELVGREDNPVYRALEVSNGNRQYDFLRSIVQASLDMGKPFLSQHVLKAFNFQAITCLHTNPGEYRPCPVRVGPYTPPEHYRVPALMDDFVNTINRYWDQLDPVALATYVLWRVNNIHPFINGNGRTARAACYFVLCLKAGNLLQGNTILPELIRANRDEYCAALNLGHNSFAAGNLDLTVLHALVARLVDEQLKSAAPSPDPPQAGTAITSIGPTASSPSTDG